MIKPPKISVIIPVYNAELYIKQCIESVTSQTFTDWELIVVDDESTDNTANILKEYSLSNKKIKTLFNKKGGVSKARNCGIDAALGDWIFFMDADDYLSPNHLQNYSENLNYDIVFQGYKSVDAVSGVVLSEKECGNLEASGNTVMEIVEILWRKECFFGPTWNKIFNRYIIEHYNIRFNEKISIREDELFTFEYLQYVKSIKVLPFTGYNYRQTPNSLMRKKYIDPQQLLLVVSATYQTALQLPLTDSLLTEMEKYYTDSLKWVFKSTYSRFGKLPSFVFRSTLIQMICERRSVPYGKRKRKNNCYIIFIDYYMILVRRIKKTLFWLLKK